MDTGWINGAVLRKIIGGGQDVSGVVLGGNEKPSVVGATRNIVRPGKVDIDHRETVINETAAVFIEDRRRLCVMKAAASRSQNDCWKRAFAGWLC
jgi:hypothetical protein